MDLQEVREQIPLLSKSVYLDNAGAGPPPIQVRDAMQRFLDEWTNRGENWEAWLLEIVKARDLFARLIAATADEIACVPNVTSGLAAVASSIRTTTSQNVVVSELNFPTNVYIWHALKQRGLIGEARVLKPNNGQIPLSDFEKTIDDKTAAVSLDYVSWINGCRENIEDVTKIAYSHGALMLVDAFHAVGVIPVDVRELGVDVLACGTYKWLMGPHGTAFLYVNREALDLLEPSIIGWHGISDSVIARVQAKQDAFGHPFDLSRADAAKNATRFEWGTWAVIAVVGAIAAIDFTLKYQPKERAPLIERLNEFLVEGLRKSGKRVTSPIEKERRSGIVTFEVKDAAKVAQKLQKDGIIVAPRVNTLRVSPHFYDSEEDINTFLGKI